MHHQWFPISENSSSSDRSEVRPHELRRDRDKSSDGNRRTVSRTFVCSGLAVSAGLAEGRVHRHSLAAGPLGDDGPIEAASELVRLHRAMAEMQDRMDLIVAAGMSAGLDGRSSVLEAYRLFTRSMDWIDRLETAIRSGLTAESAVMQIQHETRARFERIGDVCLKDWLSDLDLISNDLLRGLLATEDWQDADLGQDAIVVAEDLSAGEVLRLGKLAKAFVLGRSSDTAPAAIVAASMGIPMVVQVDIVAAAQDGDRIFVDGDGGAVVLRRQLRLVHLDSDGKLQPGDLDARPSPRSDDGCDREGRGPGDDGKPEGWFEDVLGPIPDESLRAMMGYGLTDTEIARYYGIDESMIALMRRIHGVEGPVP